MATAGKPRVLLVDDSEQNRYVLGRLLRHAGFEVQECATGNQALDLALQHPDLIILDVKLPDISGYRVCERLKSNSSTAGIPVIQISAVFTGDESRAAARQSGADAYLSHPVDRDKLVATIKTLLPTMQG
jgi:CheY-like chemotaxis protein